MHPQPTDIAALRTPVLPAGPDLRRSRSGRPRVAHGGFSLLELAVVVMILGIAAAVAAPSFYRSLRYHNVESAARRLKLDFEQARNMAQIKSRAQTLTFTDLTYTLSPDIRHLDRAGQAYLVDLAASPFEIDAVTINLGGPSAVTFDGYGKPSVGGTVVVGQGSEQRTLTLDPNTGQVTITGG